LDKFANSDRVIVKVDIEGFESVALKAPVSSQNAQKVMALCVEAHIYRFSKPGSEFDDLLGSLQIWFPGDWFIATPRCLQNSLRRYWNRVRQIEEIMPLNAALVNELIEGKRIGDLYLFGVRNSS
jgi:hypothetical protein